MTVTTHPLNESDANLKRPSDDSLSIESPTKTARIGLDSDVCVSKNSGNTGNNNGTDINVNNNSTKSEESDNTIVTLSYSDLCNNKNLKDEINKAYGVGKLGILLVKGVPGLAEARENLLPLSRKLALMPQEVLKKYECDPPVVGWSRGKEMFKGKPDTCKGSFYANPLYDKYTEDTNSNTLSSDVTVIDNDSDHLSQESTAEANDLKNKCEQVQPNIWPTQDLPELESAFKKLGKLVYEVAKPIVRQVDELVKSEKLAKIKAAEQQLLLQSESDESSPGSNLVNESNSNKSVSESDESDGILYRRTFPESKLVVGRLLHYYAMSESDLKDSSESDESWCGWHNDNSTITGLVPAMWLDEETGEKIDSLHTPTNAGLFIEGRNGEQVQVKVPSDCLAYQIGEASQILSGGVVHATPHMVKGYINKKKDGGPKICRETFAVFIEPNWDGILEPPKGYDYESIFEGRQESKLIPPLRARLEKVPTTFGDFLQGSFKLYYEMNNPNSDTATVTNTTNTTTTQK